MDGDYNEMICDQCMEKMSFLQAYLSYAVPSQQICTVKASETNENVDVEGVKDESDNQVVNGVTAVPSEMKNDGETSELNEVWGWCFLKHRTLRFALFTDCCALDN